MSCDPRFFKAYLDDMLRQWLKDNPHSVGPGGMFGWIKREFANPGALIIPLHRMRDLPKPFTISDQDRHGTG